MMLDRRTTVPKAPPGFCLVIDVSTAQTEHFDFVEAKKAGAEAVIVKATEGATYTDPMFEANVASAKKAGLLVGSYHVFRPEKDAERQAERYTELARDVTDLCPVIDLELDAHGAIAGDEVAVRAQAFVEACFGSWAKSTGLVYVSPSFAAKLGVHPRGKYALEVMADLWDLWVAHYKTPVPILPKPWKDYLGWQFSGGDHFIGGIPTDLSWFRGTREDLAALGDDPE